MKSKGRRGRKQEEEGMRDINACRKERGERSERERNERWVAEVQRDVCPDEGRASMRQQGESGTFSCTSSVYE